MDEGAGRGSLIFGGIEGVERTAQGSEHAMQVSRISCKGRFERLRPYANTMPGYLQIQARNPIIPKLSLFVQVYH